MERNRGILGVRVVLANLDPTLTEIDVSDA